MLIIVTPEISKKKLNPEEVSSFSFDEPRRAREREQKNVILNHDLRRLDNCFPT